MKPYYQDSAVTIYHGDCREIVPTLGRFDLLLTDPPYGLKLTGGTCGKRFNGEYRNWDNETVDLTPFIEAAETSIIWGANHYAMPPCRGFLVWDKGGQFYGRTFAEVDFAWTSISMPARKFMDGNREDVKEHPTQKPLELMRWCLGFAPAAQTVLDPFAGSGTTGRACKDLGRKCTMIEREERYCEIAARRMGQEVLDFAS